MVQRPRSWVVTMVVVAVVVTTAARPVVTDVGGVVVYGVLTCSSTGVVEAVKAAVAVAMVA